MLYLKKLLKLFSFGNGRKSNAIAIILLFILSAIIVDCPSVLGKTYTAVPDRDTGTFVAASPKLLGLGQQVLINIITYPAPSGPTLYAQDLVSKLGGWQNISCTITSPDGTKNTFMPIDSSLAQIGVNNPGQAEIVGSLQFFYTPTQTGNYSVTAIFPGNMYDTDTQYANLNLTVYYKPSSSAQAATFTVQKDTVLAGLLNGYPWSPLPTGYWEDPVHTNNREWAAISGDWLQSTYDALATKYNPYSTSPSSPHVLWARQTAQSGIVGGIWGSEPYDSGSVPTPSAIMDGKIYQNGPLTGQFSCIDLRTGKTLWTAPGQVTLAQNLSPLFQTASQQNEGYIDKWLWGIFATNWTLYDSFSGSVRQAITNVPSGSIAYMFEEGNPIVWVVNYGNWNTTLPLKYGFENLLKWNLTKVTGNDWRTGIEWNVSIRQSDGVGVGDGRTAIQIRQFDGANVVIAKGTNDENLMMGFDMTTGKYLWRDTTPIDLRPLAFGSDGPIAVFDGTSGSWVAFDVKTGNKAWSTQVGQLPWADLPVGALSSVANNGTAYIGCYDGRVYALNLADGHIVWKSDYYGNEDETVYGTQPFNSPGQAGANGIIYFATDTTYRLIPRSRFHALVAINETDGHYIWKLPIGMESLEIADGYLVADDRENGIQYCIGKGQTQTMLSFQNNVITYGSSALITGSVMDMSPGKPNTAAVSEADMSEWMDYLYGQNATLINSPPTPKGVPVSLSAVDPNGNTVNLGTVTTDSSGQFSYMWKPTTTGSYTIYATFGGSNSYWSSYGETALGVDAAASTPSTTQQPAQNAVTSDITLTIIAATIAIIIAIAIVGLVLYRKHP